MPAGLIVGSAVLLAIVAAAWSSDAWVLRPIRAQRWARERGGDTADTFMRAMADSGVEPLVARATYVELQGDMRASGVKNFPVRATDDLVEIYGLSVTDWDDADNLDLTYTAAQIAKRACRTLPGEGVEATLRALRTVEDVARWVQSLPVIPVAFIVEHVFRITGHGNVAIGELREGCPMVGMHVQAGEDPADRFVVNGAESVRTIDDRPRTGLLLGPDQPLEELRARLPEGTVLRQVSAP